MLNDERLNNMGTIVLGLNDALVELTGALAGFTFALGAPYALLQSATLALGATLLCALCDKFSHNRNLP